jgi:predicted Ser/Thr protein kinase
VIGRTLSHYRIHEELSRGGMGIVYRALDTKLDRDVAVKVLPPELTADETRLRRFIQEAKVAASIHHPHVATIHEIDEGDGVHFIVMELIDGEKLSSVLARGPLPPPRALELATEVVEGLSRAHEKGIVHRDLKPANIMVTADGHVKIIDFGLAKLVEHLDRVKSDVETGLRGETDPGQVLGTVSYMSPEQARGETVDHRSDLFSFGIVLYEMLVGSVPFRGKSATDTLSAILRDPAPRLSRIENAPELQHVLDRCLAKRLDERYQTAKDLLAELKRLKRDSESGSRAPAAATRRPSPMWLLAPLSLAAAFALLWLWMADGYEPRVLRTIPITNAPGPELDPAISPDGAFVAYAAGPLGDTKIYVQQVAGGRPVALTEDLSGTHRLPRWSPDGTRILFRRETQDQFEHYAVPALGGAPLRFPWSATDAAWSPDGERIAYATDEGILVTPSGGGDVLRVTDTRVHQNADETPSTVAWSPDGTRLAFTTGNYLYIDILNIAQSDVWVVPSSGGEATRITEDVFSDFGPVFTSDGKGLLFVSDRGGGRDIYHAALERPDEPLRLTTGLGAHLISLSRDGGKLAYSVVSLRQNL